MWNFSDFNSCDNDKMIQEHYFLKYHVFFTPFYGYPNLLWASLKLVAGLPRYGGRVCIIFCPTPTYFITVMVTIFLTFTMNYHVFFIPYLGMYPDSLWTKSKVSCWVARTRGHGLGKPTFVLPPSKDGESPST